MRSQHCCFFLVRFPALIASILMFCLFAILSSLFIGIFRKWLLHRKWLLPLWIEWKGKKHKLKALFVLHEAKKRKNKEMELDWKRETNREKQSNGGEISKTFLFRMEISFNENRMGLWCYSIIIFYIVVCLFLSLSSSNSKWHTSLQSREI